MHVREVLQTLRRWLSASKHVAVNLSKVLDMNDGLAGGV
jgi:hypothetical protein